MHADIKRFTKNMEEFCGLDNNNPSLQTQLQKNVIELRKFERSGAFSPQFSILPPYKQIRMKNVSKSIYLQIFENFRKNCLFT